MPGNFHHRLPFGAEADSGGAVCFRLWAPDCDELHVLGSDGRSQPLRREQRGWFRLETEAFKPGDSYCYCLPNGMQVPDPAARAQAQGVHGASFIVDPQGFTWRNDGWQGRPWETAVISELHVGTASPEGTFDGLGKRLDHFRETGITAIELMPLAQFSGRRGWGYDGVLLFAPHNAYGSPDDLKSLIDAAHERELMVLLDVVYNHFGPDGNYLSTYASPFFDASRETPWGAAIDFTAPEVRQFYVQNALYWLQEYRFDGLRFDAVDQISDPSGRHILDEIAERVHEEIRHRTVHLVLENDRNEARRLARGPGGRARSYTAQWNDDFHHAAHVALTGEADGYYADYRNAAQSLARALAEGFVYQGETSAYRGGAKRGEPSAWLPPLAFVDFLQNHDQIGNRACGERLSALADEQAIEAALALMLLCPSVPLMFQGDEWGETRPFQFFCDFHDELAEAVREGRRNEFARFERFSSAEARASIPDPNAVSTLEASRLDWAKLEQAAHRSRLQFVRRLLDVRRREVVPLLGGIGGQSGSIEAAADNVLDVRWRLDSGATLRCNANLSASDVPLPPQDGARILWPVPEPEDDTLRRWSVVYRLAS